MFFQQTVPNEASTQLDRLNGVNTQSNKTIPVDSSNDKVKEMSQSKPAFLSSDEEDLGTEVKSKPKKKKKKQTLVYSGKGRSQTCCLADLIYSIVHETDNEDEEDDQHKLTPDILDEKSNSSIDDGQAEEEEAENGEDEEDPGEKYIEYDSDENEVSVIRQFRSQIALAIYFIFIIIWQQINSNV